jgi:hypothetical protein
VATVPAGEAVVGAWLGIVVSELLQAAINEPTANMAAAKAIATNLAEFIL